MALSVFTALYVRDIPTTCAFDENAGKGHICATAADILSGPGRRRWLVAAAIPSGVTTASGPSESPATAVSIPLGWKSGAGTGDRRRRERVAGRDCEVEGKDAEEGTMTS